MEGGRSGRILRNKGDRAIKAAGCGDSGKADQKGNEGWKTAELLEGAGLKGAFEMRLLKPGWIRIT